MLIASTWRHREEMRRIGRNNADRRWDVLPQQPALAYDIAQNRLIVTAAMLQPPVLDAAQDAAAQYGAFGALVGHELTHGFDGGPHGRRERHRPRLVDAGRCVGVGSAHRAIGVQIQRLRLAGAGRHHGQRPADA